MNKQKKINLNKQYLTCFLFGYLLWNRIEWCCRWQDCVSAFSNQQTIIKNNKEFWFTKKTIYLSLVLHSMVCIEIETDRQSTLLLPTKTNENKKSIKLKSQEKIYLCNSYSPTTKDITIWWEKKKNDNWFFTTKGNRALFTQRMKQHYLHLLLLLFRITKNIKTIIDYTWLTILNNCTTTMSLFKIKQQTSISSNDTKQTHAVETRCFTRMRLAGVGAFKCLMPYFRYD